MADIDELFPADESADADAFFAAATEAIEDEATEADLQIVDPEPPPIGRTWAYDFYSQSFLKSGKSPVTLRGDAALAGWIEKCLHSVRGASVVHSPEYGLIKPLTDYIGDDPGDTVELETDIEEALLFHPSISSIEDMTIELGETLDGGAAVEIRFRVQVGGGTEIDFDTRLDVEAAV